MTMIEQLLSLSNAYAAAEGIELTTVSWRLFGDSKKLSAISGGSDIQVGRYERAIAWLSDNWPAAAEWPEAIARPAHPSPSPVVALHSVTA